MQDSVSVMHLAKFNLRGREYSFQETPSLSAPVTHVMGMIRNNQVDTLSIDLNSLKTWEFDIVSKRTNL